MTYIYTHQPQTTWTLANFRLVAAHPLLSNTEKLIWILLATESRLDPSEPSLFSYQYIERSLGNKADAVMVKPALKMLMAMGFLEEKKHEQYSLVFPNSRRMMK